MQKTNLANALTEARALVAAIEQYEDTPTQHLDLLKRVNKVHAAIEESQDICTRWVENLSAMAAMNVLVRLDALEKMPDEGVACAKDLASHCNVDVSMITRAMRTLISSGIFEETGKDQYKHNAKSLGLHPRALGGFVYVFGDIMESWLDLPKYAKSHQPEDLLDLSKSPIAYSAGREGMKYYEILELNPKQRGLWNLTLQNLEKEFPVLGMFPFETLEKEVRNDLERPFIVDIGGGRGQALRVIRDACGGGYGGRLILQDLPIVIESLEAENLAGIEPMAYDIFTKQPVKNAHVYFMRRLLHDFYNPTVVQILKNTASAMGPDSRLIVCDMLVPELVEVGGPMTLYWLDFALLAIGGRERTLEDFNIVAAEAGLELAEVYKLKGSNIVMVELRLQGTNGRF